MERDQTDGPVTGHALRQSKALAAPSRVAILDLLRRSAGPMTAADIAERCGLHASTVQQHLTVLVDAGLVESGTLAPTGRGRPRVSYRPARVADSYRDLSQVLVGGIADPSTALRIGRIHGDRLDPEPAGPAETIRREAERMGFAPSVKTRDDGTTEIVLHSCPIAGVATGNEKVVCAVHRGIAEGVLAREGGLELREFIARRPSEAGCVLVLGPRSGPADS